MPRIAAATVAEHRAQQRAALLAAARSVLLDEGLAAVTPGSIAKRAGLARSSFYQYFPSVNAVLAEVAVDDARAWVGEIAGVVDAAEGGAAKLAAYIQAAVRMVAEGKHAIADALSGVAHTDEFRAGIAEFHHELAAPLYAAVRALELPDPELQASLIQGVIDAAIRRVSAGADAEAVAEAASTFVLSALGARV